VDRVVSGKFYPRGPDGNGVELYWDRPEELRPRSADGALAKYTRRLGLESLLREPGASLVKFDNP
jgi:catechol 2,3-dioxygenase